MESLPEEILREIMMAVPYNGLKGILFANKMTHKIGQSQYFWEKRAEFDLGVTAQTFRLNLKAPQERYLQLKNRPFLQNYLNKIYELGCLLRDQRNLRDLSQELDVAYLELDEAYSTLPLSVQRVMQTYTVGPGEKLLDLIVDLECKTKFIENRSVAEKLIDGAMYHLSIIL